MPTDRHRGRALANRLTRSAANNISVGRNGRINVLSDPAFYVVPGSTVKRMIEDNKKQAFDAVEATYRFHGSGNTLNPDSCFLRYPYSPGARIIALPAHVGGAVQKSGINGYRVSRETDPAT